MGDPTDSIIAEFKAEMIEKGISDFFILKKIQHGTFRLIDTEDPKSCKVVTGYFEMYGFWLEENEAWIKKYDNCGEFNTIKLPDAKAMEYYLSNLVEIRNNEVGMFKPRPDSIANGEIITFFSMETHTPLRFYWFFQESNQFEKFIDKFNLTTAEDHVNLNYESNNNLAIVKLNSISEAIIDSLNKSQVFYR
ncbi:MAG: hypothetical protein LAT57_11970 [Balneolales bacterium]|nr:hypothetical protein [Balneolales bacterium]